ncbi:hypothetical protein GY45DRAFT_1341486 [Cubamyces sp. BRFM 1775]|nr:hypothetical protein GY45DRAFT_1341486 [Cubamyces sp. BRFM 1775]
MASGRQCNSVATTYNYLDVCATQGVLNMAGCYLSDGQPSLNILISLNNLEQNNYPNFGEVRHCSQLPVEQDPAARARVRAWLNGSYNPVLPIAWSLAQQDFTMRDETNLCEWLLRQLIALEVITPRLTGDVWPIRPGYTYRTVFGMYKTRTQAVEYDIACSVVEENHRISATVVFCPIEVKIDPTFEQNQEEILGWLRAGRIDHPAVSKSGTLPASIATLTGWKMYVQLLESQAPAGILIGLNTVYLCELQGHAMWIKGPLYRYYSMPQSV